MKFGDELDTSLGLVERLEDATLEIIDFITNCEPTTDRFLFCDNASFH